MTCEVAVMNKRGIALAADSAVTLGDGPKTYRTAEKLFQLSPDLPVAIMTYGNADITGVPWEIVIKTYRDKLRQRRFDTLQEYASDFVSFISSSISLFPEERQELWFRRRVGSYWSQQYRAKIDLRGKEKTENKSLGPNILENLIRSDIKQWEKHSPIIVDLGLEYGDQVVKMYTQIIDELVTEIFDIASYTGEKYELLRDTVRHMYTRRDFLDSHIVIAGMGELEPFPSFFDYAIGGIAAGRLMWSQVNDDRISDTVSATIAPFSQRYTIDMIINGIHPHMSVKIFGKVEQLLVSSTRSKKPLAELGEIKSEVEKDIEDRQQSIMSAVDALPRQDLARMAEALVSLTAFLKEMAVDEQETVGGPIDVALLSKGEGFAWIKHKSLGAAGI